MSTAQIERIFAPHQTTQERNVALQTHAAHHAPVWLRTCYAPALADIYATFALDLESILGNISQILDDKAVYGPFSDDWSRVLLRIPAIVDTVFYVDEADADLRSMEGVYLPPGEGEEYRQGLYDAQLRETTMLYLIDEEALQTDMIKVLWLDIHGNCIWDNRILSGRLREFKGRMFDGGCLGDLYDACEDVALYQRGALLDDF